jgi:hypothetical protein
MFDNNNNQHTRHTEQSSIEKPLWGCNAVACRSSSGCTTASDSEKDTRVFATGQMRTRDVTAVFAMPRTCDASRDVLLTLLSIVREQMKKSKSLHKTRCTPLIFPL